MNANCSRCSVGRDSSVGLTTRYRLEYPGIESWWGNGFSVLFVTGSGAHPASITMDTGFVYHHPPSGDLRTIRLSPFWAWWTVLEWPLRLPVCGVCDWKVMGMNHLFEITGQKLSFSKCNSLLHILYSNILHGQLSWHRTTLHNLLVAKVRTRLKKNYEIPKEQT